MGKFIIAECRGSWYTWKHEGQEEKANAPAKEPGWWQVETGFWKHAPTLGESFAKRQGLWQVQGGLDANGSISFHSACDSQWFRDKYNRKGHRVLCQILAVLYGDK